MWSTGLLSSLPVPPKSSRGNIPPFLCTNRSRHAQRCASGIANDGCRSASASTLDAASASYVRFLGLRLGRKSPFGRGSLVAVRDHLEEDCVRLEAQGLEGASGDAQIGFFTVVVLMYLLAHRVCNAEDLV